MKPSDQNAAVATSHPPAGQAMRLYGAGTIEQRGARFRVRVPCEGKYRDLGTYDRREEAQSVRRGWAALAASGQVITTGLTLRDYGVLWLDRRELRGGLNMKTDRSRWLRVLEAPFADWQIRSIRTADIQAWADGLTQSRARDLRGRRSLSPQTVRHCVNLLRGCLRSAVKAELLTRNPATEIELPSISKHDGWTYLLPEEQVRLTECREIPEAARLMIAFAIGTGLRQGEQYALELRDLHVGEDGPRAVVRWGKPGKPPKNKRIRVVPLFGLALEAARRWVALLPSFAPMNPHGLVFPTARGNRQRDGKPPRYWRSYLEAAGLADADRRHDRHAVRWHDLRHTCASSLVAGWWGRAWRLEEVREVLGHTSITVTERYAHLAHSVVEAAAAATPGAKHHLRQKSADGTKAVSS